MVGNRMELIRAMSKEEMFAELHVKDGRAYYIQDEGMGRTSECEFRWTDARRRPAQDVTREEFEEWIKAHGKN